MSNGKPAMPDFILPNYFTDKGQFQRIHSITFFHEIKFLKWEARNSITVVGWRKSPAPATFPAPWSNLTSEDTTQEERVFLRLIQALVHFQTLPHRSAFRG